MAGWLKKNIYFHLFFSYKLLRLLLCQNPFLPTVPTFAVRETDVSRHNGGTSGSTIMPGDVSLSDSKCRNGGYEWVQHELDCSKRRTKGRQTNTGRSSGGLHGLGLLFFCVGGVPRQPLLVKLDNDLGASGVGLPGWDEVCLIGASPFH